MRKHYRECISICQNAGLTVSEVKRGKKHIKVICEEGFLLMPSTPSDRRWQRNALSVARRMVSTVQI
jgi:hypothetical protein